MVVVSLVALGCAGRSPGGVAIDGAARPPDGSGVSDAVALGPVRKLDLLVLIDDSVGVHEEGQQEVARALLGFLAALRRGPHGSPDVHLGVVSQDMGAGNTAVGGACRPGGRGGALLAAEHCGIAGGAKFLIIDEAGTPTNASRPLEETLLCLTNVGAQGCGYEHFLAAATRALSGTVSDNAGFARADADLALFVHADEDDCSAPSDTDFFIADVPGQTGGFRCALRGHRCHGRPIPAAVFDAPFAACDDDPQGGGRLIPVDDFVRSARAVRPARRLFVGGVIGLPIPGDPGRYQVYSADRLNLNNVCGLNFMPGWVGSAAPSPRLARFIAALGGTSGSLCHGPSHHEVTGALAASINAAR